MSRILGLRLIHAMHALTSLFSKIFYKSHALFLRPIQPFEGVRRQKFDISKIKGQPSIQSHALSHTMRLLTEAAVEVEVIQVIGVGRRRRAGRGRLS